MRILGHGVDVIECPRILKLLEDHGDRFLKRVFTEHELEYCHRHKESTQHLAGRFAAKEAVLKALGTGMRGRMKWTDVEIANDDLGKPEISLSGESADVAKKTGVSQVLVSISHTREHAVASAIAMGEEISKIK
ncbi:MAG: holo-ACP synthase [Actinobacteria bacterium]|nr:holo-ACP synthase [Actinomycetota bacterium]